MNGVIKCVAFAYLLVMDLRTCDLFIIHFKYGILEKECLCHFFFWWWGNSTGNIFSYIFNPVIQLTNDHHHTELNRAPTIGSIRSKNSYKNEVSVPYGTPFRRPKTWLPIIDNPSLARRQKTNHSEQMRNIKVYKTTDICCFFFFVFLIQNNALPTRRTFSRAHTQTNQSFMAAIPYYFCMFRFYKLMNTFSSCSVQLFK